MSEYDTRPMLETIAHDLKALGRRMDERFDAIEQRMGNLETRMTALETRMGSLEKRLINLEKYTGLIRSDVSDLMLRAHEETNQ